MAYKPAFYAYNAILDSSFYAYNSTVDSFYFSLETLHDPELLLTSKLSFAFSR